MKFSHLFIIGLGMLGTHAAMAATESDYDKIPVEELQQYVDCAKNNSSCGGKIGVNVGTMKTNSNIGQGAISRQPRYNCLLSAKYVKVRVSGNNKVKMPDNTIFDLGNFDFNLEQDYKYGISSIKGGDWEPCSLAGRTWDPSDGSTRQENIDKFLVMLEKASPSHRRHRGGGIFHKEPH